MGGGVWVSQDRQSSSVRARVSLWGPLGWESPVRTWLLMPTTTEKEFIVEVDAVGSLGTCDTTTRRSPFVEGLDDRVPQSLGIGPVQNQIKIHEDSGQLFLVHGWGKVG